jgi:NAD-dependent SIR2 family protein deacetylase
LQKNSTAQPSSSVAKHKLLRDTKKQQDVITSNSDTKKQQDVITSNSDTKKQQDVFSVKKI